MLQDHERLIEKKRYELEHHPVQKQVRHSICKMSLKPPSLQLLKQTHAGRQQIARPSSAFNAGLPTLYAGCTALATLMCHGWRHICDLRFCALQYVVETKYVGERDVAGAATEIVGQERNVVKEQVKPAAAGTGVLNTYRRSVCRVCVQTFIFTLKCARQTSACVAGGFSALRALTDIAAALTVLSPTCSCARDHRRGCGRTKRSGKSAPA